MTDLDKALQLIDHNTPNPCRDRYCGPCTLSRAVTSLRPLLEAARAQAAASTAYDIACAYDWDTYMDTDEGTRLHRVRDAARATLEAAYVDTFAAVCALRSQDAS